MPPPWPRKKRWRHRRRDALWRLRAFVRFGARPPVAPLAPCPAFPGLAVATVAVTPKYQDWCLSMIDSLRHAGAYAGPVYVVTENPAAFEGLENVAAIAVPATRHRVLIKSLKPLLSRWVPAPVLLYLDADVIVAQPLRPWYQTARGMLPRYPLLAYPDSKPVPGSYHAGVLLADLRRARPLLERWLAKLRSGYHHLDQVCLKAVADPTLIGYFPDRDFAYLHRCLAPAPGTEPEPPRRFVHVTNGMIEDHSPEALASFFRQSLGLRRLPRALEAR